MSAERDARTYEVDPRTVTGTYHVVAGRYGKRRGDRPLWWVASYHLVKAVIQVATILALFAIAAWAKSCGIVIPGGG